MFSHVFEYVFHMFSHVFACFRMFSHVCNPEALARTWSGEVLGVELVSQALQCIRAYCRQLLAQLVA